jgi:enamine deaminase RidA (YjgF/YER057c/UK114 family)
MCREVKRHATSLDRALGQAIGSTYCRKQNQHFHRGEAAPHLRGETQCQSRSRPSYRPRLRRPETYQYAPAVRIGDQILISGIVGADAEGRLPPDFRSQAENVFTTLEAILSEAGATLDDVASLNSYHVGDLDSQLRELVDIKATRIRPPHPAWTGVGVTQLGCRGRSLKYQPWSSPATRV